MPLNKPTLKESHGEQIFLFKLTLNQIAPCYINMLMQPISQILSLEPDTASAHCFSLLLSLAMSKMRQL